MKRYTLLLATILLAIQFSNGQLVKTTWNWHFGQRAAVDFSSGNPVAHTNSAMQQWEGVASLSDYNGNLMMYSDGVSIWDRTHNIMPNGFGLLGHQSSTMSVLILPQPQNPGIYYVFTCDAGPYSAPPNDGINYSKVDMSLNAGLGDVYIKNVPMLQPATEKLVATRHANGCDYWVISTEWLTNNFYAWQVTDTGIMAPVVSSVGTIHNGSGGNTIGLMQLSPDGKRLALTNYLPLLEMFDFDPATGIVSNPLTLSTTTPSRYGLGWSPDGSKLYTGEFGTGIVQYDMNAGTTVAAINGSRDTIAPSIFTNDFRAGPDGKLYVARSGNGYLDVINNPNLKGAACDYQDSAVFLLGRTCGLGLPNFALGDVLPGIFENNDFTATSACVGQSTQFSDVSTGLVTDRTWNFGDPGSGSANTDTAANPGHTYASAGTYTVELLLIRKCRVDTVVKTVIVTDPPVSNIPPGGSICPGQTFEVDAGNPGATYTWSTGDTTQIITVSTPGTVIVEISVGACAVKDTIIVSPGIGPTIDAGPDLTAHCDPVDLAATAKDGVTFSWSPPNGLSDPNILNPKAYPDEPTVYTLTVTNADGCSSTDDVEILPEFVAGVEMPNAFTPNGDGINDLIYPLHGCIEQGEFTVVNRFGKTVYKSRNLLEGWDGKYKGQPQPIDTYVYVLSGTSYGGEEFTLQGNITLMR
jgi:gliding motility-associated-like protein